MHSHYNNNVTIYTYAISGRRFQRDIWVSVFAYQTKQKERYGTSSVLTTMLTSSSGNIFRVIGHLCGEFTGHRWISRKKARDEEYPCYTDWIISHEDDTDK